MQYHRRAQIYFQYVDMLNRQHRFGMAEEPPLAIGLREDGRTATGGSKIDTAYGLDAAGGYTIGFHGP